MKIVSVLICVVALSMTSCAKQQSAPHRSQQPATDPSADRCPPCKCDDSKDGRLSAALMSRLAAARAYHHQADILLRDGQLEPAITKITAILALDLSSRWPESEEVRVDATARLAKLLLRAGRLKRARAVVDAELSKKPRESFYLANLHSVRGELLEAQVKKLDTAGKKQLAKQRAKEAIAAFEVTIRINKRLQAELLRRKNTRDQGGVETPDKKAKP
jgi:tetratricopeptide (TPR) repeat protein